MNFITGLTREREWQPQHPTMPLLTNAKDLKLLGKDRMGRSWYVHARYGELREEGERVLTAETMPNAVIVDVGGGRYRVFAQPKRPGTFALNAPSPRRAHKPAPPVMPIDGLADLSLLRHWNRGRGLDGLFADLARQGVRVTLADDRGSLVYSSPGGRLVADIALLDGRAGSLLLAHKQGNPRPCRVSGHKGKPPSARTQTLGGTPWCGECEAAS